MEAHIHKLSAMGMHLDLDETSRQIMMHQAELSYMEESLLPVVNLGLLQVNCIKVC